MTEEYLYDPDPKRRRKKRTRHYDPDPRRSYTKRVRSWKGYKTIRKGPRGGAYFAGPHRKRYDPGIMGKGSMKNLMDNVLVLAGAGLDSYLTTKKADTFGKGFTVPTLGKDSSGNTIQTTMPYTEAAGIAGGIVLPLFTKGKTMDYIGKFLTGMGANGVAKIADPPATKEEKKEIGNDRIKYLMEVY